MSPIETREGKQVSVKELDIPDEGLKHKKEEPALLSHVKAERNLRRFIRPDGMFVRDVHLLTPTPDNEAQALETVKARCEAAGRVIEVDYQTGRFKAVPGWNYAIRVPGMESSELKAPTIPKGEAGQKIQQDLVVRLQEDNQELKQTVAELTANMANMLAEMKKANGAKPLDEMTHNELDEKAAEIKFTFPDGCTNKPDKVEALHKVMNPEPEGE